jgi:hypothetical protein
MKRAADDASHVGVHRGGAAFEGETCDGAGGVATDAGQLPQLGGIGRHDAAELAHHLACQLLQVGGAPVVAEAVPTLADGSGRRGGQMVQGGIAPEEAVVVALDPRDLGLLQHHFRHEYPVRIPGAAPGQVAPMPPEPAHQPAAKGGRG